MSDPTVVISSRAEIIDNGVRILTQQGRAASLFLIVLLGTADIRYAPPSQTFIEPQVDARPWRPNNLPVVLQGPLVFEATPQLVGLTQAAAIAILQNAGLFLGTVSFASNTAYPVGIIASQSPAFSAPIVIGGSVNIVISTGVPSPTVMPTSSSKPPNLPNTILPPNNALVDERGVIATNWWRFLLNVSQQAFGVNATQPATVTVTASPFVFTAVVQGSLLVAGGPVSLIEYSKDAVTWFPMGIVQGPIQVVPNDHVRITYTNAPALTFFPR